MNKDTAATHTSVLWQRLFKAPSVRCYLDYNKDDLGLCAFSEYITELCRQKGEVPERIIKRAGVERAYGHQIFRGSHRWILWAAITPCPYIR